VQIVVVSSPGLGGQPHWSHEVAGAFARLAVARGATVRWLAGLHAGQPIPPGEAGLQVVAHQDRKVYPAGAVNPSQLDAQLELALTECLRLEPLSAVVHFGLGAQGTPNVLWLADRMGSKTFACVRGVELVCHRGDLLDRDKVICTEWSSADRCRWCCSDAAKPKPSSDDMLNRVDLFIAGLATAAGIFVSEADEVDYVTSLGVSAKGIEVGATAEQILDSVIASAN